VNAVRWKILRKQLENARGFLNIEGVYLLPIQCESTTCDSHSASSRRAFPNHEMLTTDKGQFTGSEVPWGDQAEARIIAQL
jgi:hypothetical protein